MKMIKLISGKENHKGLLLFLVLFAPIAIMRFMNSILFAWNSYIGEFLGTFPFYFLLERYNPLLYQSVRELEGSQFLCYPNSWYYGPVHHLWLFPATLFIHSAKLFFRSLLIFHVFLVNFVSFLLYRAFNKDRNFLFGVALFTIILGSFALNENIVQRNVELLEFSLITIAYLCLKKNHDYAGGSIICFAAMAKLLPFIFLPYLVVKKRFKAVFSFVVTFVIIFVIVQLSLGWQHWAVLDREIMKGNEMSLTADQFLGKTYFTAIRQTRGSFYNFILSLFSKIDMSSYIPKVTYGNFIIPNLIYLLSSLLFIVISLYLFYKTAKKGNLFYEFSIVSLTMLLISHHTNPHYYIFTLFAFISFLKFYTFDLVRLKLTTGVRIFVTLIFILAMFLMGNLIPFSIYDRLLPLKNQIFHYFSTLGIFGLATFILWCLMFWLYQVDYKKVVS